MVIRFYPQPDGCIGVKIGTSELYGDQHGAVLPPSAMTNASIYTLDRLVEGKTPTRWLPKEHDPWHGVKPQPLFGPQDTEPDI